jgi:hypothetical protein
VEELLIVLLEFQPLCHDLLLDQVLETGSQSDVDLPQPIHGMGEKV